MASYIKSFFSPTKSTHDNDNDNDTTPPQQQTASTPAATSTFKSTTHPQPSATSSAPSYDDIDRDMVLATGQIQLSLLRRDRTLDVKSTSAIIVLMKRDVEYEYEFRIFIDNKQKLIQAISSKLPTWFDSHDHSIQWSMTVQQAGQGDTVVLWHAKFTDAKQEESVKWMWQQCIAEQARKEDFKKAYDTKKAVTTDWIGKAYTNDVDMTVDDSEVSDAPDSEDYNYAGHKQVTGQYQSFMSPEQKTNDALSSDEDSDDDKSTDGSEDDDASAITTKFVKSGQSLRPRKSTKAKSYKNKNQQLAVGMAENRTYVGRGHQLGVFRHDADGNLEYVNKINELKSLDGKTLLSPNKMMLTNADHKMLILSGENSGVVYEMDMNRGEVVSEYRHQNNEDFKIREIGQTSKYAELESNALFTGVNKSAVFTMDTRSNEVAQIKQYAQGYGLNTLAADDSGNTVVGSDKGEIRLYNDISKAAKTLLPGLGDAIIGVDVTRNGKHILVTTAHYLLLIPTTSGNVNGFTKSITNTAQPPIKLQLEPTDILTYNITDIAFTAAHFDIGSGAHDEQWIVTSTGPFIITWNVKKVLRGRKYDYKIKKTTDDVVADQFVYNKDKQVAVALADDVFIENRNSRLSR